MANQTVTTTINYDDAAIAGLLNGESIAIDGGALTIDSDVRWNQQAAVFGDITISPTLSGSFTVDGTKCWELYFDSSTGNVPVQNALGSNGVTSSGGATGELMRVWATNSLTPEAAGGAMPATGWIKLRSKTGEFADNEIVTLPGGATITLTGAGKRSWINVVGTTATTLSIPRLGSCNFTGDWYELGLTNGSDDQVIQGPVATIYAGIQIETAPGSGVYEWWANAAEKWNGQFTFSPLQSFNSTLTANAIAGPTVNDFTGNRLNETAVNGVHTRAANQVTSGVNLGVFTVVAIVKKFTRRYVVISGSTASGATRYGALVDLDTGTIISNPSFGTPTNTSSSITSMGGGWYKVEVSLTHTSGGVQPIIALSDSATPTLVSGLPSYLGVITEGVYFAEIYAQNGSSVQYVSSTDERGKFFGCDEATGQITLAKRTNGTAGLKPTSGCKIRIPNVICTWATSFDYSGNARSYSPNSVAYRIATPSGGVISIDKAALNWSGAFFNGSVWKSISFTNLTSSLGFSINGVSDSFTVSNSVIGMMPGSSNPIVLFNSLNQNTLVDCRFIKATPVVNVLLRCANVSILRCQFEAFGAVGDVYRINPNNDSTQDCSGITYSNCKFIGTGLSFSNATNSKVLNCQFANRIVTQSSSGDASGTVFAFVLNGTNLTLDGLTPVGNLQIRPYPGLVSVSGSNIAIKNIGSISTPYDTTPNPISPQAIVNFVAGARDILLQRIYVTKSSLNALAQLNTTQNVQVINVSTNGTDPVTFTSTNSSNRGNKYTPTLTGQNNVYGTHWDESFRSATAGGLVVFANEPIAQTASQCIGSFAINSGFTSNGTAVFANLADTITWTLPYYAIGHTSIANQTGGTANFIITGPTNPQHFEFDYQIDLGTGTYTSWKHLVNAARQSTGGTSGTNTVDINATDESALLRKPQIGDIVQSTSLRLPAGTTITNVATTAITLSNNFVSSMTNNELLYFWDDIASETISASIGFALKVRAKINTASATNTLASLSIPTDSTSAAQLNQYPLPYDGTGVISNIDPISFLQIYNVTTSTELFKGAVTTTSYTYNYYQGTTVSDGDTIRIRIAKLGKLPQTLLAVATSVGFAATSNALDDEIYIANGIDGSTVTEFNADYPNIDLDINDPDGTTTVQRIYAWLRYIETTNDGIEQWFDIVTATDQVNYEINTNVLDLKLDNTQATPVKIIGGRFYRSDGNTIIETTSGSIQLDPNRIYVIDGISTTQDAYNNLADTFLRRSTANVESSSFGDPLSLKSIYGMVAQGTHNTYVNNNNKLVVTKSDESTQLGTRSITNSPNAQPITGLDSD